MWIICVYDEVDYDNECAAECDAVIGGDTHCSKGKCGAENVFSCNLQHDPLCCEDDAGISKTYNDPCAAGFEKHAENVAKVRPMIMDGSDVEYDNACLARCDGVTAPEFSCKRHKCADKTEECTLDYFSNAFIAEKNGGFNVTTILNVKVADAVIYVNARMK